MTTSTCTTSRKRCSGCPAGGPGSGPTTSGPGSAPPSVSSSAGSRWIAGKSGLHESDPARMRTDDGHLVSDPSRLITSTGWRPRVELTDGLAWLAHDRGGAAGRRASPASCTPHRSACLESGRRTAVGGSHGQPAPVPLRRPHLERTRRQGLDRGRPPLRGPRVLDPAAAGPLRRPARTDRGDDRGRGGDDHAAGRLPRVRQRLPPPARARQGARHDRRALRRPRGRRHRRRLDGARLRAGRHAVRPARRCACRA